MSSQIELAGLPLPEAGIHVWQWFYELHQARGTTGFGPAPLRHADLEAWINLTRQDPRPHEIEWLFALDRAFLKVCADSSKKKS